jgi:hypothetical protein
MAYATPQHGRAILALAVALLLASPMATTRAVAATSGCEGDKLPAGKSYAHCAALPYLGAKLHWTYDAKTGSLSVAFVAKPAGGAGGWVSWAINPTGDGMKGAQALLAFKGASTYVVNTYNITGYNPLGAPTPIAYKATDLTADESGGEVRIYGKLQLGPGLEKVNHIWQVGSKVTNGAPAEHAFDKPNLQAKGKLVLSGAAQPLGAAAPAPAGAGASPTNGGGGGAAPSGGKSAAAAATAYVSAPALTLLALAGFLLAM